MVIERTSTEYIIRLPLSLRLADLQDFLNYLRYCELTSKFEADESLVDELVADSKRQWRAKRQSL